MNKFWIILALSILIIPMASPSFAQEFKTFSGAGKDAGNGMTTYDIQYTSDKTIISASVKEKEKSLNLVLVGKINSNENLVLKLPKGLINGPFVGVWEDGQIIQNFTTTNNTDNTLMTIPITPLSENISIVGTTVVPEFGQIATMVLIISIVVVLVFTRTRFAL